MKKAILIRICNLAIIVIDLMLYKNGIIGSTISLAILLVSVAVTLFVLNFKKASKG